jgi:hypothetical protein
VKQHISMSVKYHAPSTAIDPSFWEELYTRKLDVYKLDTGATPLAVRYTCASGSATAEPFRLSREAFLNDDGPGQGVRVQGSLTNVNTVEDFKNVDKQALLDSSAACVWDAITTLAAVRDPSLLQRFVVLTFADLKAYRFTYWCAAPALLPAAASPPLQYAPGEGGAPTRLSTDMAAALYRGVASSFLHTALPLPPVFALRAGGPGGGGGGWWVQTLADAWPALTTPAPAPATDTDDSSGSGSGGKVFVVYVDTAPTGTGNTSDGTAGPLGWPARNLLALLGHHLPTPAPPAARGAYVVALRGPLARRLGLAAAGAAAAGLALEVTRRTDAELAAMDESVGFRVLLPPEAFPLAPHPPPPPPPPPPPSHVPPAVPVPRAVGWELNERGKPGPRVADLSAAMDPVRLATQARPPFSPWKLPHLSVVHI